MVLGKVFLSRNFILVDQTRPQSTGAIDIKHVLGFDVHAREGGKQAMRGCGALSASNFLWGRWALPGRKGDSLRESALLEGRNLRDPLEMGVQVPQLTSVLDGGRRDQEIRRGNDLPPAAKIEADSAPMFCRGPR